MKELHHVFKPSWSGFRVTYTLSSTSTDNLRFVVFCSHAQNFETHFGDSMPVEWSTCQLSENATCGQGVRTRLLSCVRSDGKPVSMDQCEQVICLYLLSTGNSIVELYPTSFNFITMTGKGHWHWGCEFIKKYFFWFSGTYLDVFADQQTIDSNI